MFFKQLLFDPFQFASDCFVKFPKFILRVFKLWSDLSESVHRSPCFQCERDVFFRRRTTTCLSKRNNFVDYCDTEIGKCTNQLVHCHGSFGLCIRKFAQRLRCDLEKCYLSLEAIKALIRCFQCFQDAHLSFLFTFVWFGQERCWRTGHKKLCKAFPTNSNLHRYFENGASANFFSLQECLGAFVTLFSKQGFELGNSNPNGDTSGNKTANYSAERTYPFSDINAIGTHQIPCDEPGENANSGGKPDNCEHIVIVPHASTPCCNSNLPSFDRLGKGRVAA